MELTRASTDDIFDELRRRHIRFIFAGVPRRAQSKMCYACQVKSLDEIRQMISQVDRHIRTSKCLNQSLTPSDEHPSLGRPMTSRSDSL